MHAARRMGTGHRLPAAARLATLTVARCSVTRRETLRVFPHGDVAWEGSGAQQQQLGASRLVELLQDSVSPERLAKLKKVGPSGDGTVVVVANACRSTLRASQRAFCQRHRSGSSRGAPPTDARAVRRWHPRCRWWQRAATAWCPSLKVRGRAGAPGAVPPHSQRCCQREVGGVCCRRTLARAPAHAAACVAPCRPV